MTTATDELVRTTTTDAPDEAAHIVYIPEGMDVTAHALVLAARIEGFEIQALCGYRWIPRRDPEPLPVCVKCAEIFNAAGHQGKPDA
ncbi:MAG: hypothetical protein JWO46_1825 [Nocardioidaceae bacterium]|nr:hypothetical protein [Nocardioidaceae bacterium]